MVDSETSLSRVSEGGRFPLHLATPRLRRGGPVARSSERRRAQVHRTDSEEELLSALGSGKSDISTAQEVLAAYKTGRRAFPNAHLDDADFGRANLGAASFYGSSLRRADFSKAILTFVQLKGANLTNATLSEAAINATDLIATNFTGANFTRADCTGAAMNRTNFTGADLRNVSLGNAHLDNANLTDARLDGAYLSGTVLSDLDISALCDAKRLRHGSPSYIEARTVIKSYGHPKLKQFMLDCGVPPIFAEYMIDCARASGDSFLRSLMQTTFISYGGPDEVFARKFV